MVQFGEVYQTNQVLLEQKLMENAEIEKFKCDIFGDFQTMCSRSN